ncbi:CHASE3 domain-containing protein [Flavobacterium sp.]|uniref:CHASE3 domain-containing protein n=1 Tax=Flavobacterium sp. TaxID=239 RepID=UPI002625FBCA|nr:CHASE3 domain-containing protein [Flavobacterium sp.]
MTFTFENKTKIFYALAFVTLLTILSVLWHNSEKIKASNSLINHTKNVLQKSDEILVDMLNIETGARGYALMGQEDFLDPYHEGLLEINKDLDDLKRITNDNSNQQIRFDSLSKTISQRIILSKELITLKRHEQLQNNLHANILEKGKVLSDSIRHLIIAINTEELALLKVKKKDINNSNENSLVLFVLCFVLIVFTFILIAIIIENQKASQRKHQESENNFRNLIENLPVAVYTVDSNGYLQIFNKVAIELWGRTPTAGIDQWCGATKILNLDGTTIPIDQCPMVEAIIEKRTIKGTEIIVERPDGTRSHIISNPQPVFDSSGKLIGGINTLMDITQERKSFDECKLLSQYTLSLIEASRDPMFTVSPDGKITDTNQATAEVTGVSKEKLIGSDFINYFTEPEKAEQCYEKVFSEGFVVDYPLVITDGELVDVLFNGAVYKDDQSNVIGAVVVCRDISSQKKNEKELTEAKTFAELATAIAEEAKINAEKAALIAINAVKSKQQFLSNMSHEIRTPMNAIIGFTKVVLKTSLTSQQKQYLMAIKTSGDALIVLINDILDLAKVDAGKMTFEQTPFKLSLSIIAMLHLFESKIHEKNLKLTTEYDEDIPEVLLGDPVRLHQIILNLVGNAVKFTTKGTIAVSIHKVEENDERVIIEFIIADTGIGIDPKKIDTIFENFQQATSETTRLYGGTGLGLAIVKQLVEAQQGSIKVISEESHGSRFIFRMPFKKTTEMAVLEEEIIELDQELQDIKILVVEDMELNQLLMKTLLDDFGFACDITANGKLAIEKLQEKTYDIILMDLQMPEMNGFEATEYIRNTMKLTLPIMALTADVTTVDLAKCKAVGMNDYVAKPIDERLLYSKIIGLIKKPILIIEEKTIDNQTVEKVKYVDLQYLNKLTRSNPTLMTEMITVYLSQTPTLIDAMKQGLIDKDWKALKSAAHKIIPSFTIMGISSDFEKIAVKIQEYANNMEKIGDIGSLISKLETVCNSAYAELETELNLIKNKSHGNQ